MLFYGTIFIIALGLTIYVNRLLGKAFRDTRADINGTPTGVASDKSEG